MTRIEDVNGSDGFRQLAHLLRIGIDCAREIAPRRRVDAAEIVRLADQGMAMAGYLDRIDGRPAGDGEAGGLR